MTISFRLDRKAVKRLGDALDKQVPFATAVALTRTAMQARDAIREGLPSSFVLRNQFTRNGIRYQRAEKRQWPNAYAVVGSISPYMEIQEEGGTKAARAKAHSIPKGIRSAENRTVPRSKWPGRILAEDVQIRGGGRTKGAKKGSRTKPKPFLIQEQGGVGVYVRKGRKRRLKRLYRLTREPLRVRGRHWLTEPVHRVVTANLGRNFERAIEEAMRPKG
jgi:hypothetical protein